MKTARLVVLAAAIIFGGFLLVEGIITAEHAVQADEAAEVAHQWRMHEVFKIHDAIDRMYQCTSEIYSTLNGGGPICQDACQQYEDIRKEEQAHIAWMDGKELIGVPDPKICMAEDKRTEEK